MGWDGMRKSGEGIARNDAFSATVDYSSLLEPGEDGKSRRTMMNIEIRGET